MKKIFALILTFALTLCTLGALTSCGGAKFDENKNISVVTREDGSGTKSAFMEIIGLKGKTDVSGVIVATGTAAVLQEVKGNPLAIGYDSLGYITDEVKVLKVDGVEPTLENIKNGSYKISRPLNVVYGESKVASEVNTAFLTFLQSSDAQTIISDNGYVSTKEGAVAYTVVPGLTGEIAISGSTSLKPLMEKLAAKFEEMQSGVSVTVGGGEPRLKMMMNGAEFEEIDCSILSEFLTTLPRTAVHVPNPTFKVSVIGRRMLTYCSTFGAEE